MLLSPDEEYPSKEIFGIVVCVGNTLARTLSGPALFDPSLILPDVAVENLSSGEMQIVSRHGLALGTAEQFEPATFYEQPQNEYFYYCAGIEGDVARIFLVESFQLGGLVQAEMMVKLKYANHYSKIVDPDLLARLRRRLAQFNAKQSKRK